MSIRKTLLLGLLIIMFLPVSCTKLERMAGQATKTLTEIQLPEDGSIPSEYGKLISVSNVAAFPDFLQLWFQDESGDIRMVRYSVSENRFLKVSHLVSRN